MKKLWPINTFALQMTKILKKKDPELFELFKKVSAECCYPLEAVIYTHYALVKDQKTKINTPDQTCENFLELFNEMYSKNVMKGITALKINSSKDLGVITFALRDKGIIEIPAKISADNFTDQFEQMS